MITPPRIQRLDTNATTQAFIAIETKKGRFKRFWSKQVVEENVVEKMFIIVVDLNGKEPQVMAHHKI